MNWLLIVTIIALAILFAIVTVPIWAGLLIYLEKFQKPYDIESEE